MYSSYLRRGGVARPAVVRRGAASLEGAVEEQVREEQPEEDHGLALVRAPRHLVLLDRGNSPIGAAHLRTGAHWQHIEFWQCKVRSLTFFTTPPGRRLWTSPRTSHLGCFTPSGRRLGARETSYDASASARPRAAACARASEVAAVRSQSLPTTAPGAPRPWCRAGRRLLRVARGRAAEEFEPARVESCAPRLTPRGWPRSTPTKMEPRARAATP